MYEMIIMRASDLGFGHVVCFVNRILAEELDART